MNSIVPQFLPWQKQIAQQWLGQNDRFSHAWLIHGEEGIGKFQFAHAAAAAMLCENRIDAAQACGKCQACRWLSLNHHPDLRVVVPDSLYESLGLTPSEDETASSASKSQSNQIRVQQIRALDQKNFFTLTSHRGGAKVLIIYPAERLNQESANAILKILEEPLGDTRFLLVSNGIKKLLPTIVSRCQRLHLPIPEAELSLEWLKEQGVKDAEVALTAAGGAPFKAKMHSESDYEPVRYWLASFVKSLADRELPEIQPYIDKLDKIEAEQWLDTLQRLLVDLQLNHHGLKSRYFPSLEEQTRLIADGLSDVKIADLFDWLRKEQLTSAHSFNKRLLIQACLQKFMLACLARSR
ncbi:MAG: DNA polymerase III subunit delta' [Alcaligenaceae bacterium]|jgi:DNA polymerase-3 subunit delta'|nr:DNA polymerase III subunit delta' [Alcaligenaceae bacterium]